MSYIDFLKLIDKGAHSIVKHVEIKDGVKIPVYGAIPDYETPLDKQNLLTDIYDKLYLSHPLTYDQKQLMANYEALRSGNIYSFSPMGNITEPVKIGRPAKMSKKKIGLKSKKNK